MKSTFSRMVGVALTMWLGFAAGTANASLVTFDSPGWDFSTPGVASATWGVAGLDSSTTYTDWIQFSLPSGSNGSGAAATIAVKATGFGVIDRFELWQTDSSWNHTSLLASGLTGLPSSSLLFSGGIVPGFYSLETDLHGANSYSGSIVTAVPEPETYAMLLVGLGLLGFAARRRSMNN